MTDLTMRQALEEAARQGYAEGFRDGRSSRVPAFLADPARWQAIVDVFLSPELFAQAAASRAPAVGNQVGNREEL